MIFFLIFIGLWIGLICCKSWITFIVVISLLAIFVFYRFKRKAGCIFLISFVVGLSTSFIKIETNKNTYVGMVIQARENYYLFSSGFEKFYVKNNDNAFEVGDILTLNGDKYDYDFATLECEFDFNEYLANKGAYKGFNVDNYKINFKNPIRVNAYKKDFLSHFRDDTKDFIGSIYFGNGFQNSLSSDLQSLHLYRLSTLSGLSIYAILSGLTYLLALKIDKQKAEKISFIILIPYFLFTLSKFAIFKMCSLFIFKAINKKFLKSKLDYISLLSLFGIACLIFNKNLALQNSFNLSFLMSIFFYFYNNSFPFIKHRKKKILTLIVVSLFFLPFETIFYHEVSLLGPLIQTILSPYIILISIVSMLCFYHIPIYAFNDHLVLGLAKIANFIKPFSFNMYCPEMPLWLGLIYECCLFIGLYYFSIRFRPFYKVNIIALLCFSIYFIPISNRFDTYISFINIGQGDSTLIHHKGLDILVDTGGSLYKDIATTTLIPYFKSKRIYSLDYLITTHDDFDHIGAKDSLMENFKVKNYLNDMSQFPLIYKDFRMDNLNIYSQNSPDENENSLVLNFNLKGTQILIMGDAPKMIENYIMKDNPNLRCDILKVGHHGSNTSSSLKWVKFVDPDMAIISCGKNNKYGHPHEEVLTTLKRLNIKIRRTDIESTITLYF